jgi:hypothetical protein
MSQASRVRAGARTGVLGALVLAGGCHRTSAAAPDAAVSEEGCPTPGDSGVANIVDPELFSSDPDHRHRAAVSIRAGDLPPVPDCPGGADVTCPARDDALARRQQADVARIACVLSLLGDRLNGDSIAPLWYEPPARLSSGQTVPIGVEFALPLTWSEVQRFAAHPFVDHVEPAPREPALIGRQAPPPHADCPTTTEAVAGKLDRAGGLQNAGRRPAVVELRDDGFLPKTVACATGQTCAERTSSLWERTVINTRQLTCVNRRLDAIVTGTAGDVSYAALVGDLTGAPLPPFGQGAATVKAFGVGLTWEEANTLAAHPWVESVWTSPDLQFAPPPMLGCPPDLAAPIPVAVCTDQREAGDAKMTDADKAAFQKATGAVAVMVGVRGGAASCPLPECPATPCPEQDAAIMRASQENLASQACVRQLVASLDGMASPDTFWLINAFTATLTWAQIQAVAAYPDVTRIEGNAGANPP